MEELTSSWMNDPNAAAVADRLQSLDEEAWASSAHQASKSSMREFLSDIIGDETDKLNAERRDEAAFHPDVVINVSNAGYSKEQIDALKKDPNAEKIGPDSYMIHKDAPEK